MNARLKRIGIDIGGYFLIFLGITTGWLPGPGGIPLILGGLALLSLHNEWAKRLREWLISHGANFIVYLFPQNRYIQILYDIVDALILAVVAWLAWNHAAYWQIGLATALFVFMLLILAMNRDRLTRLKRHYGKRGRNGQG